MGGGGVYMQVGLVVAIAATLGAAWFASQGLGLRRPMAGYTIRNLKDDVENMAPKFGMAPAVEAHFGRKQLDTELLGASYFRVAPNSRLPFGHRHADQEEVYVVVEGSGRVKLDDKIEELHPFDAIRVAAETIRCFEGGPDGLGYIAFGGPSEEAAEAEFFPDFWKD
jgi:mannose-6-phosphate isomerase-like protein (cupin superfamily)